MAAIVIKRRDDLTPVRARDSLPPDRLGDFDEAELSCRRRRFFPVDGEQLKLFEIEFDPGAVIQSHAHSSSEIIYVTSGELHLGAQVCGPGTAIFVDADTLYGFKVGPEGATFLNFRGDPKPAYFTKAQLLARRSSQAIGAEEERSSDGS